MVYTLQLLGLFIVGPIWLAASLFLITRATKRGWDTAQVEHLKQIAETFGTDLTTGEEDND